jgi:DNA-binding protein H-NS
VAGWVAIMIGTVMKRTELERMSIDNLWTLHEEISEILATKMAAENAVIEERLNQLKNKLPAEPRLSERRPYPVVLPKFRNPDNPSQTWAGRGKQPRWLKAQLRSGKGVDEFRI